MTSLRDKAQARWPEIFRKQAEIGELHRELRACEGWKLAEHDRDLGISHYVFRSNCSELQKHLDQLDVMEISFDLPEYSSERNLPAFAPEAIRLLHNVSAAASTLADHSMRFVKKQYPEGGAFCREYGERVKSVFQGSGIFHFIAGLRNYVSHRKMPSAFFSIAALVPDSKPRVILQGKSLLEWDGWNAAALEYIQAAGPDIDVANAVDEYETLVKTFYEWLHARREELHGLEYRELKGIREQLRGVMQEQRSLAEPEEDIPSTDPDSNQ